MTVTTGYTIPMKEQLNSWQTYHENTKERSPSKSLVQALNLVQERDTALDLGAGALTDTKYLLENDFKKVVAVDSEPSIADRGEQINDPRLEINVNRFENFEFAQNTFDLINAQFSLPFTHPTSFEDVFVKVKNSLKQGGIFVGQLFGDRDEWANDPKITFHTREQALELLSDLEVIEFNEEEKDGTTASGSKKHWHFFRVLAQKK